MTEMDREMEWKERERDREKKKSGENAVFLLYVLITDNNAARTN
jgi:hypothetical protein